jgi:hypothetical protein
MNLVPEWSSAWAFKFDDIPILGQYDIMDSLA